MNISKIDSQMAEYIDNGDISGAALLIRRGNEILYKNMWGYANTEKGILIQENSIYRMMSMTKIITAVAVMICMERGLLKIDDPVSAYIPEFHNMKVSHDPRYVYEEAKMKRLPLMLLTFKMSKVKTTDAEREITIRDLLSHSSGLQQGLVGLLDMLKNKEQHSTLKDEVLHYSRNVLDFQPGTGTGYSPLAGFDILGYIVSIVSGKSLNDFVQDEICHPLDMMDTTFFLNNEQKTRLVSVYKRKAGKLVNVTGTKDDVAGFFHSSSLNYEHGCGGIYSTLMDYDKFGYMLLNNGSYKGIELLRPDTVELMHTEAPAMHLEPEPGFVWGLGVKIRQNPDLSECKATKGTYGWSGAFGTHFFISPEDNLEVVFMTNRSDLNGSGSYISAKIEEMVFGGKAK